MSNPIFDETVMTVGTNVPTFEPAETHEQFLERHQYQTWLNETFTASQHMSAPQVGPKPRKRTPPKKKD